MFDYVRPSRATASRPESLIERRYAERMMKRRLHQPAFRARVISAHETKCAVCQLGHERLLDAAHITPDSDESSSTSVTNGFSLCKSDHTEYDVNILGIDPDYKVHARGHLGLAVWPDAGTWNQGNGQDKVLGSAFTWQQTRSSQIRD